MVYRNVEFLLKHALVIMSRLRLHHHWKLAPVLYSLWHLATVCKCIASKRGLGLVTCGLVLCGNRSPSLYRADYIMHGSFAKCCAFGTET